METGSISEFFAMGGYAVFVWSAYGVAAVSMGILLVVSWRTARSREATLAALQARLPGRRRRGGSGEGR